MGWKFKFSAQDRDLEYLFGRIKNPPVPLDLKPRRKFSKIVEIFSTAQNGPVCPDFWKLTYIVFQCFNKYVLVANLCQHPILLIYYSRVWSRCGGGGTTEMLNSEAPKGKELKWTRGPITSSPTPRNFKVCISGYLLLSHAEKKMRIWNVWKNCESDEYLLKKALLTNSTEK